MQSKSQEGYTAWHVSHTKQRQEFRALHHLQSQSYDCFLPALLAGRVRRGKSIVHTESLLSRYIFIKVNPASCKAELLSNTRSVSKLLSFGGRFATVSEDVISALQHVMSPEKAPGFSGEHIVVRSGPPAVGKVFFARYPKVRSVQWYWSTS
jgi:transcriptional antiterminator RfaH